LVYIVFINSIFYLSFSLSFNFYKIVYNKNFSILSIVLFGPLTLYSFDFGSNVGLFGVGHLRYYNIVGITLKTIVLFDFGIGVDFVRQVIVVFGVVLFVLLIRHFLNSVEIFF
jgi:hypothetical protein